MELDLVVILIVILGIVINPFSTDAKEIHWGFKKTSGGIPTEAGAATYQLLQSMVQYIKEVLMQKLRMAFDNGYEIGYTGHQYWIH